MDFRTDRSVDISYTEPDNRGRRPRLLSAALALCLLAAAGPVAGNALLTIVVVDAESGEQTPARCSVIDSLGYSRFPYMYVSLYHTYGEGYFYCDGDFTLSVPTGPTIVRIAKGPEYYPYIDTLTIHGDTTVTRSMERIVDMRESGWYSGDVEIHIDHVGGIFNLDPSDAHWMGLAEDLHFVNCLDNGFWFTGASDTVSTEDCVVYMSEELRNHVYGHCALPGLKSLVEPVWGSWDWLLMDVADSVHAQDGPLMICSHPVTTYDFDQIEDWPGSGLAREMPVDVIYGKIDAIEVMSYSNINGGVELDMWYKLLNCGFRMPPCAGSDAAINRAGDAPIGGFRVYVEHKGGRPDIYQWLEGIAAGRTFVTNGPLFTEFRMLGSLGIGDSLYVNGNTYEVFLDVTAECAFPMDRVDIVMNGRVVDTLLPEGDPRVISGSSNFSIYSSCWIAAMAVGPAGEWVTIGDELFAHTGPFYFDMNGEHIRTRESAVFFMEWVDSLIGLAADKGEWITPEDSIRAFSEFGAAREWYANLVDIITGTEDSPSGSLPAAPVITVHPNPFSCSAEIRFEVNPVTDGSEERYISQGAAQATDVAIYDVSGRLVRRLAAGGIPAGRRSITWDGRNDAGKMAASGIYFCRVRNGSTEVSAKILLVR